jgi:hypothetical protein
MRIGDFLYFAPDVRFTAIDLSSPSLGMLWERRIRAYYLDPASTCIASGYAFAAGLLLTATIDAMSRLQYWRERAGQDREVGPEFRRFLTEWLPSFSDSQLAGRFYRDFRNGLTHEARIKDAGEFSLHTEGTIDIESGILRVNPRYLAQEVEAALIRFVSQLTTDETLRSDFAAALRDDFSAELGISGAQR